MSIVDDLLNFDIGKYEIPTSKKTIYLSRLKRDFTFNCRALETEKATQIQMKSIGMSAKGVKDIDMFKMQALTVIEGCSDVFRNKEIQEKFEAPIPLELVRKLLSDTELSELYNEISGLSSKHDIKIDDIKKK